jgi:hypothetical protein
MYKLKFTLVAGFIHRTQLERIIRDACYKYNLELTLEKSDGFFDTKFYVVVQGPKRLLIAFRNWVENIAQQNS